MSMRQTTVLLLTLTLAVPLWADEPAACKDATWDDLRHELRLRDLIHRANADPAATGVANELRRRQDTDTGLFRRSEMTLELQQRTSPLTKVETEHLTRHLAIRATQLYGMPADDLKRAIQQVSRSLPQIDDATKAILQQYSIDDVKSALKEHDSPLANFSADQLKNEVRRRSTTISSMPPYVLENEVSQRPTAFAEDTKSELLDDFLRMTHRPGITKDDITAALDPHRPLANCDEEKLLVRAKDAQSRVIGPDDRVDIHEARAKFAALSAKTTRTPAEENDRQTIAAQLTAADAVAAILTIKSLPDGKKTCDLVTKNYAAALELCPDVRFADQPVARPACTGFLVQKDVIATAAHCLDIAPTDALRVVFDYEETSRGIRRSFATQSVYHVTDIIDKGDPTVDDWTLLRLNAAPTGRTPLALRLDGAPKIGDPVYAIGFPDGLPKKIAGNAKVRTYLVASTTFTADLDTFAGNSGSPVLNATTNNVEGILKRGEDDYAYITRDKCKRVDVCMEVDGCANERITKIESARKALH